MTAAMKLHSKLAQVMYEAESIPKNGTAPAAMGGFKFVQVGDAAKVIRKALAEKNVSMIPTAIEVISESEHETQSKKVMTTLTVRTTWTLTDGETGETAVIQSMGSGADTGDKAAPKAQSNAMKYALLMGFLLSTGDDPEQTDTSDRQARRSNGYVSSDPYDNDLGPAETRTTHRDGLVGKAITAGTQDFELRQHETKGFTLPFRIKEGRLNQIVLAQGELAMQLADARDDVLDKIVTVWGHYTDESFPDKKRPGEVITYKILNAERVKVGDRLLPVADENVIPVVPGQVAAFDQAESDAIDREAAEVA